MCALQNTHYHLIFEREVFPATHIQKQPVKINGGVAFSDLQQTR